MIFFVFQDFFPQNVPIIWIDNIVQFFEMIGKTFFQALVLRFAYLRKDAAKHFSELLFRKIVWFLVRFWRKKRKNRQILLVVMLPVFLSKKRKQSKIAWNIKLNFNSNVIIYEKNDNTKSSKVWHFCLFPPSFFPSEEQLLQLPSLLRFGITRNWIYQCILSSNSDKGDWYTGKDLSNFDYGPDSEIVFLVSQ